MLHAADMDPNLVVAVDDAIDPNIFNIFDVANSEVSPDLDDIDGVGFTWADDLISSTELDPSNSSGDAPSQTAVQSTTSSVQQVAAAATQHLLQGGVLQQQMTGGVQLMAVGAQQPQQQQQQQQGVVAVSRPAGVQTQRVIQNQTIIQSNISSQQVASPFILKASAAAPATNTIITGSSHQFLPSSTALVSRAITPTQSPSPHLSRSLTPSQTLSSTNSRPQSQPQVAVSAAAGHSNINLLQLNQSPISQQVPLQSFVTNQTAQQNNLLQGHAVLSSHGSNIVHTQNALIQNPNVVNVNVAHVLPNQLNLQGTLIQTPQGKFLIQSPAGSQQLPGQLNLGALSNLGQVQMAGGVGLGQTTVMAQPSSNVALGSTGVTQQPQQQQQQPNFSLVNLGGPQGQQILIQRSPAAATQGVQASLGAPVGQTNLILRTVAPSQQLLQPQPQLPATASTGQTVNMATAQVTQQLVTQAGPAQNLQLQQLITTVGGGQSLRLVGQPSSAPQPAQGQAALGGNVLLQPMVGGGQQVRLIGQQQQAQAGSKPGTVTLNLAGQNLNLQQLQSLGGLGSMQGIQLSTSQQQPQQFLIQQQQQQQQQQVQVAGSSASVVTASVVNTQQNSVQPVTSQQAAAPPAASSKKSKSNNKSTTGTSTSSAATADNILSQALSASGIGAEDMMDLYNGSAGSEDSLLPTPQPTPPPAPPPAAAKSKKKKKKKKEKDTEPVQPVVLSSTQDMSGVKSGLSTASSTAVTTTISQAAASQSAPSSQAAGCLGAMHLTISGQNITTSTTAAVLAQPVIGLPTVATTSLSALVSTVTPASTATQSARGGKHGPPNVSVKPVVPHVQLSLAEKQQLLNIQTELQRLQGKAVRTQADLALVQQLDMQRKKLLAQAQSQILLAMNQQKQQQQQQTTQQQVPLTSNLVGQPVVAQPQVAQPQVVQPQVTRPLVAQPQVTQSLVPQPQQQQVVPQVKVEVKSLPQVQAVSCANSVLQIQGKSITSLPTKLKLVTPKVEPILSPVQTDVTQDSKSVLVASSGTVVTQATVGSVMTTQVTQSAPLSGTGNVVVAMSSPHGLGQTTGKNVMLSTQQNVVRLQFAQKTQSVTMTSSTPQQVIVPSPQKVTVVANGSGSTMMSASPAVQHVAVAALPPSQARPVQIKIANQVLTLQLTPSQQEKLELHLSRMTLEQQQAFLHTQKHVLAKLQLRTETLPTPPHPQAQASHIVSGNSASAAAVVAPTVVAAVSAGGDAGQKVVMAAPSSVTVAAQQQLPVTVQALESNQTKAEAGQSAQAVGVKRVHVHEVPKASMIHQQLSKDQANALAPDTKNPFKDYREACRRLLRYHTFQSPGPPDEAFEEADSDFERMSEDLVEQKDAMLAKYRLLLMEESTRGFPTAEMVFILRMLSQDMHNTLREDKQIAEKDPDSFIPMPQEHLERKLPVEEDSSEEDDDREHEEEQEEEEEEDNDGDEDNGVSEAEGEVEEREVEEGYNDNGEEQELHEESRNDADEDDSVLESSHPESANTSYENTSLDESFDIPSSPVKGEESVEKSESQPSSPSPPPPPPSAPDIPPRGIFKLVIRRNDEKGFTSRLASERRKSLSEAKEKKLYHQSKEDRPEEQSRHTISALESHVEKEEESNDEVEYVDVDKFSRNVSVKLERLSDSVSQVYGVDMVSPTSASAGNGSSRKRRKGETESEVGKHKRDRHSERESKMKMAGGKDSEVHRTGEAGSRPSGSCSDWQGAEKGQQGMASKRSESKKHGSKCKRSSAQGSTKSSSRNGHGDSENVHKDFGSGGGDSTTETRSDLQSAVHSIMDMQNQQFVQQQQQDHRVPSADLEDFERENSLQGEENMHPPAFPGQIPASLIQTEKMFNLSSSDNEMETSFENDADPQRTMMNPEVQHAIDSILNGSGGSAEDGRNGETMSHHSHRTVSTCGSAQDDDHERDVDSDGENGREGATEDSSAVTSDSQEMVVDDDLDAAVQSILM